MKEKKQKILQQLQKLRSNHLHLYKIKSFIFLNIVVNPETAHFEADLEAELQKTYRRLNITYEIVKMTGQAFQKNAKYSQIAEISEIKFSKNYIRRFSHRHGIRQDSNKSNLLYKLMLKFVIQY